MMRSLPASVRGRAGKFMLTTAAGLALASGVMTGTSAATAMASSQTTQSVHANPRYEPCPCADPLCRPVC